MGVELDASGPSSVLIVDGDPTLAEQLAPWTLSFSPVARVLIASTLRLALVLLAENPALVIAEACLPDGDSLELVRAARNLSRPPIVMITSSRAERRLVAALMQEGADAYFEKPVIADEIRNNFCGLRDAEAQCRRMARMLVGRIGLKEAQLCLRGTMHVEALARTGGSRRAAASLLKVDRRYVQRMAIEHQEGGIDEIQAFEGAL